MAAKPPQSFDKSASGEAKKAERAERQGAALRANLHRRKDQARRRSDNDTSRRSDNDTSRRTGVDTDKATASDAAGKDT